MIATERLRALLDERGVDYKVSATGYSIDIGPYTTAYANRTDATLDVSLRQVTPEQAVAATLGPGTCHKKPGKGGYLYCSECGYNITGDWSAYCPNCGRRVVGE